MSRMKTVNVFVFFTAALLLAGCEKELYDDLNQSEANEIVATLEAHGMSATREKVAPSVWRVNVTDSDFARAVEVLQGVGLPRQKFASISDLFPSDRLIESPSEEKAKLAFALDQDISRSIASLNGVSFAWCHVAMPNLDLRGAPVGKPTASVSVRVRPGLNAAELAVQIKTIVANAVPGLSYHDISVVLSVQKSLASTDEPAAAAALLQPSRPFGLSFNTIGTPLLFAAALAVLSLAVLWLSKSRSA